VLTIRSGLKLADVFWPAFVERDGVILLSHIRPPEAPPGAHPTLSEYERFHGHTHIQDLFRWNAPTAFDSALEIDRPDPTAPEHIAAWELTKRLADMWFAKLRRDFPDYRFRVYASRLDDPILHFHRVREEEPVWISDEDAATGIADGTFFVLDSEPIARQIATQHANER
jgi:hypothetical protein